MSEYTVEDFAGATLATRGEFEVARRINPSLTHQWHAYGVEWGLFSDAEMAADGWVPVGTKKAHDRVIKELRYDLTVALAAVADLQDENDRLERILQAQLSLKDLQVAWENAEQADECRKGDVLIRQDDYEVYGDSAGYAVYPATSDGPLMFARILSRAPKREPWADLADVLTLAEGDIGGLNVDAINVAALLHDRGVRVTGGDDDE